jgi:hypothetical protein
MARIMKKISLVLLLLLALCVPMCPLPLGTSQTRALVQIVFAQGNSTLTNETQTNQTLAGNSISFDRAFYNPTKVVLSFPYTNLHAITDISTIGMSQYKYSGGPDNLEFEADSVDIYTFTATVEYDNASSRNILVTIWEGDRPAEGYTWTTSATEYDLHFRLNVIDEPAIPTSDELAQALFLKQAQFIVNLTKQNEDQTNQLQSALNLDSIMIMISLALGVVAAVSCIIAASLMRKARHSE